VEIRKGKTRLDVHGYRPNSLVVNTKTDVVRHVPGRQTTIFCFSSPVALNCHRLCVFAREC